MDNNNGDDLFESLKKGDSDIDDLLEDAFSFMNNTEDDESYISEDVYGEEYYNDSAQEMQNDEYYYGDEISLEEMKKEKKKKIIYSVLIAVLSICIIAIAALLLKFSGMLGQIYDPGEAGKTQEGDTLAEDDDFDTMYGVSDAASLNDALKKWATNGGELMQSDNVINILLIGQDGDGSDTTNGRADSLIIASVNKAKQTITLASVMRDSYTYMNVDGTDRYQKINASCFYGGPKGAIKVIEQNYKIDIDYYASVYFGSFKNVIDALGGVEVPIEPGLASYINRTTRHTVSSGDAVKLNGEVALVYSRIRYYYSDSDVSRTANQRRVINAIMNKAKGASIGQLYNVVEAVLPYMKTNMSQSKILSYGRQALTQGWINYSMQQETFPTENTRATTSIAGVGSSWVVDYPLAAQQMQQLLYGKTNISLSSDRVNVLDSYLSYQPNYTGSNSMSQYTGNTGTQYTEESSTSAWTGENITTDIFETTDNVSESTTSWLQGILGGNNSTTTTQQPVTDSPVTDAPVTDAPVTGAPETEYQGGGSVIPTP